MRHRRRSPGSEEPVPEGDAKPAISDRTALVALALLASLLGNILLLQQLFVGRQEFTVRLESIDQRLSNLERRLGVYEPPPPIVH